MEVIILGSGTSMGVPVAGCQCRVCTSDDPRDQRLRTSAYLNIDGVQLLIDTSVDYRQQMLIHNITYLDAVIYTHHHVDHILGLDDLRSFNIINKCTIPIYGREETLINLRRVFAYAFTGVPNVPGIPRLSLHRIDQRPFTIKGVPVIPVPLMHGKLPIFGYRIGDFAYCTDVNFIPEQSYQLLRNLKVLILDALRFKPHPTHFSVEEAVREAQKIGAEATYFTHISHNIAHAETEAKLPPGIHLAYDGLRFQL